jgi:hypothetical protein
MTTSTTGTSTNTSAITMQQAIERIIGPELAGLYDQACRDWVERLPAMAPRLTENDRPSVVPAAVTPYGRPWLGWIDGAGTSGAAIHIPTHHMINLVTWRNGRMIPRNADGQKALHMLRHEIGHHVQHSHFADMIGRERINAHRHPSWIATILAWYRIDGELHRVATAQIARHIRVCHSDERGDAVYRSLPSFNFEDDMPAAWVAQIDKAQHTIDTRGPAVSTSLDSRSTIAAEPTALGPVGDRGLTLGDVDHDGWRVRRTLQCIHCDGLFVSQRSDARFCGTKCRVAANRAAKAARAAGPRE